MAFMGRGGIPSINNTNAENSEKRDFFVGRSFFRRCYYIPLDNTYVAMQILLTCIILIVGGIAFLFTYKSSIIDPLEETKKLFINTYLIVIGVLLVLTLIVNFSSKSENTLIKGLVVILFISVIIMLAFLVIRLNLDSKYNKNAFEKFYLEQNIGDISDTKSQIGIGISGMSLKTEKEYYVDECIKLYNIFKIKTYGSMFGHLLLNILLMYQILRVSKIQSKKDKLNKDDVILFDEEQNVRF